MREGAPPPGAEALIPHVAEALRGLGRSMESSPASLRARTPERPALPPPALELDSRAAELDACLRLSHGLGSLVQRDRESFARLSAAQESLLLELSELVAALESATLPAQPEPAGTAAATPGVDAPGEPAPVQEAPGDYVGETATKLELLRRLHATHAGRIEPVLEPVARLGHAFPDVEALFGLPPGEGFDVLEDLADLGLVQRELHNRVHACPRCRRCQVNFREQCPSCDALEIRIEPLVHHFRCGYTGLESEYQQGLDLHCPKCRRQLFQLGQDFDRPHETYLCDECQYFFEEPLLSGQCFACAHVFHASEAEIVRIFCYRPTPLSIRAVEQNRLVGLEVDTLLVDTELRVATRDFLEFEITRELDRTNRYRTPFSLAILGLQAEGRMFPIFRDWGEDNLRTLCHLLSSSLRTLDMVSRLGPFRLAILMPQTPASGAACVRDRLLKMLGDLSITDTSGHPLTPFWRCKTWSEPGATLDDVRDLLGEEGA